MNLSNLTMIVCSFLYNLGLIEVKEQKQLSSPIQFSATTSQANRQPIVSSDMLVWLKQVFFSFLRICNTRKRKKILDEAKIAIKQTVQPALLVGRFAGEVRYG